MPWFANPVHADIAIAGDGAHYAGPISAGLNREFFEAIKGKNIRRLVITSSGGEIEAGIALGLWAYEQRVDIEVPEYCLSSCANYVFPAGQQKSISAGAVVAWHGNYHHLEQTGLWRDDIPGRVERYGEDKKTATAHVRKQVEQLVQMEHDFFTRIDVNEYLCWIGKMPPYSAPNYYFLSSQDMARFGVLNVRTPPDYENTDVSGFEDHIMYIKLER